MPTFTYTWLVNVETKDGGFARWRRPPTEDPYQSGDTVLEAWSGQVEAETREAVLSMVYGAHNRDDRPSAQRLPSMSVGDVVLVTDGRQTTAYACTAWDWVEVDTPDAPHVVSGVGYQPYVEQLKAEGVLA